LSFEAVVLLHAPETRHRARHGSEAAGIESKPRRREGNQKVPDGKCASLHNQHNMYLKLPPVCAQMEELQRSLADCKSEIELLDSQVNKIEEDLCVEIDGSVFYEHLLSLFRKEYRPPSLSIASNEIRMMRLPFFLYWRAIFC